MKNLLSALMITCLLGTATYSKKSEAGIVLVTAAAGWAIGTKFSPFALFSIAPAMVSAPFIGIGILGLTAGGMSPAGAIVLLVLDENGSLPQDKLESLLSEKYQFIADREAISSLASTIKAKAESMEADAEGKKLVTLSEEEVRSILSSTEISEEEMNTVIKTME